MSNLELGSNVNGAVDMLNVSIDLAFLKGAINDKERCSHTYFN